MKNSILKKVGSMISSLPFVSFFQKKVKIIIAVLAGLPVIGVNLPVGYAQTTTENYVQKRVMYGASSSDYVEEISYLDGLGRPVERVLRAFTPSGKDLAFFTEYDSYGRVEKEWLPAVPGVSTGAFQAVASLQTASKSINADESPYSSYSYEGPPLNRVLKESGPGKVWHTAGRTVSHSYTSNSATDAKTSAYMLKGSESQVTKKEFILQEPYG